MTDHCACGARATVEGALVHRIGCINFRHRPERPSLPPVLTTASKIEQAKEKVSDLFQEADNARHCAHEAAAALDQGNLELAGQYLREAEKHAGVLPARVTWAVHAVASAQAESSDG